MGGGAGHRATMAIDDDRKEALQLSWKSTTNQSAGMPPTGLWGPRLNPRIPREKAEGEGKVGGGPLIHFKQ